MLKFAEWDEKLDPSSSRLVNSTQETAFAFYWSLGYNHSGEQE